MKNLFCYTLSCFAALILFASVFQVTGCGDSPPDIVAPAGEETRVQVETVAEPVGTEPTSAEETFSELRNLFPQPILEPMGRKMPAPTSRAAL